MFCFEKLVTQKLPFRQGVSMYNVFRIFGCWLATIVATFSQSELISSYWAKSCLSSELSAAFTQHRQLFSRPAGNYIYCELSLATVPPGEVHWTDLSSMTWILILIFRSFLSVPFLPFRQIFSSSIRLNVNYNKLH